MAGNVVVIFSWWLLEVWWMRQLSPIEAFGRVYELLNRGGGWLNVQPEFGKAPHEYSSRLGARLAELPSTSLNRTP